MLRLLRLFFAVVLVSMLAVTSWAGLQVSLFDIPREVGGHPWFVATLFDTYSAFFTFYLWLAYRERRWPHCLLWFVAIVLLGNIAMSVYGLIRLASVPRDAGIEAVLLADGRPVAWWVPAAMIAAIAGIGIVAL